ncbi:MAG: hypothetical protein OEM81_14690 [Acidimicrobiia bacterium]|nr:hypothetical protein [Acidimicrobiia bacterium]MDH3399056.1 hypothetical protein [Acidimicrobiia bacterium]MDH5615251.1 hypothetical protein [Acidimicrobiia bacterium]
MSDKADSLDLLINQLLVEAHRLDRVVDSIEPIAARILGAWQGPAADRLLSELGERRREVGALATTLRSLAAQQLEEVRRIRMAEAAALTSVGPDPIPGFGTV